MPHSRIEPPLTLFAFMPTAFDEDDRVNLAQMSAQAALLAAYRVCPAVLGGLGEFYAVNRAEARDCIEAAVDGAAGMAPVAVGIGHATREAEVLAQDAGQVGASTLVVNPPYYVAPSPAGFAEHVRRLTEISGLPAVTYSSRQFPLTDAHIEDLVDVEGFRGIKEEHYSPTDVAARVERWGDRIEWWGVGELGGMDYVRVGATSVTSSLANFSPAMSLAYVMRADDGRADLDECVREWAALVREAPEGSVAVVKTLLELTRGWSPRVRLPLLTAAQPTRARVSTFVERFGSLRDEFDDRGQTTGLGLP